MKTFIILINFLLSGWRCLMQYFHSIYLYIFNKYTYYRDFQGKGGNDKATFIDRIIDIDRVSVSLVILLVL